MVMGSVLAAEVTDDHLFHLLVVKEADLSEAGLGLLAALGLLRHNLFLHHLMAG